MIRRPAVKARIKDVAHRVGLDVAAHPGRWHTRYLMTRGVDLVIDVGAADGSTGAELRRFGYRGRIESFEPLQSSFHALEARARKDPAWNCHHLALSNETSRSSMVVSANRDSSSLLPFAGRSEDADAQTKQVGVEDVVVVRLDDLADQILKESTKPFLKLDTQGSELLVLDGATRVLDRIVGIQLELSFVELYEGAPLADEVLEYVRRRGFQLAGVFRGFSDPQTGEQLQCDVVVARSPLAQRREDVE